MATITSNAVTGNWSATSSWVGGAVPDPVNDTAVVAVGAAITLDDSRTIPATVIEGRLTQGTSTTTTLGGVLQCGNGSGKDGQFDFGAGAALALGTYNLVLANCKLTSNAKTDNWAVITGSGNIQTDATTTYPAQDINLRYVSHQNTGSIHYAINSITGAWAPVLDIQHCAFYGNGDVVFGEPGWNSSVNVTIKYSDFDNTGDIGLVSAGGGSGVTLFEHNTLRRTSGQKDVYVYGRTIPSDTNIFYGYGWEVDKSGNGGPHAFTNSFFARLETESSTSSIVMDDTKTGYTIGNNYFYAAGANPHIIQSSGGWSGGGTHAISGNIFEIVYNADGANPITIGKHDMDVYGNLLIGSGSLVSAVASGTSGTINEYNNTYYGTYNVGGSGGGLWLTESNISGATINIYNNLQSGSLTTTYGVANIISGQAQPLGKVGYNNFYNTTTPYAQGAPNGTLTFGTDNTSHDLAVNPNFVDPGCNLATWGVTVGADGSVAGAIAKLLAINGYNPTTKKQSDTPSGVTVASLISWVQAGFVPRNAALKTAGEGGTYIGAMDVQITVTGISNVTLTNLSQSADGVVAIVGTSSTLLGLLTQIGAGTISNAPIIGQSSGILSDVSGTESGTILISSTQSIALMTLVGSAQGVTIIQGQAAAVLAELSQIARGTAGDQPQVILLSDLHITMSNPLELKITRC